MCINITRLASGALLVQVDATEIVIDLPAITTALPAVLLTLTESSKALGQARKEGYEAGLVQGHAQGRIEAETRQRIAQRDAEELLLDVPTTLAA
jgi:hypothetical protein